MSIIVHGHMYFKNEEDKDLLKNVALMIEATKKDHGCISYTFVQESLNKTHYMMVEQWESKKDLEDHLKTEHYKTFVTYIESISSKPGDLSIFETK
ncbi:ABM domain-containing protein [Entamoeba marina]